MKSTPVVNAAAVEWKLGRYGVASAASLTDAGPWQRAQEYRRLTSARMAPLDRKDLSSRLPSGEYHLSKKIDGEFTLIVYTGGETYTVNPGGTVRVGLPLLDEVAAQLQKAGVQSMILAGELYYRRPDGGRERVHDVSHAARAPGSQADLDNLHFAAFDILEIDGQPAPAKFADTYARLEKLFAGGNRVRPVEASPTPVRSVEEIDRHFTRFVDEAGGEGVVLRSDSLGRYKVKPRHTLDVAVIGFTESSDRPGLLHDLLVAVMRKDGSLHVLGHIGTGFSDDERRALLSDLKDRLADSDYIEPSGEHVAYQMVRPELVIEVSCLDLVSQTTRGASIDHMTLDWDKKAGRYAPLRRLPLCSLISPVYLRRRDDKQVNATDVRLAQVSDIVDVAKSDVDARNIVLPKSAVLRREVYTKLLKGQTLVRKLLLFQTHKESTGDFPAYVLHFTDWSPTRKEPLQREIRVSNSRDQIDALWIDLQKEYIVRGWNPA